MIVHLAEPDGFDPAALELLSGHFEVLQGDLGAAEQAGVGAIFVRLANIIDAEFLRPYRNLRFVISPTTGLDHIDTAHLAERGITLISLKGETAFLDSIRATAEHTLALVLGLIRRLPAAASATRAGLWDRYAFQGRELAAMTVCVLGYGRIGRQVTQLYEAFGARVHAHDIVAGRVPERLAMRFPKELAGTDLLSVHLPLEDHTRNFVGRDLLESLPRGALVVNTARGDVVDQDALFDLLTGGHLGGAALDVLRGEPAPLGERVASAQAVLGDRLIITPHIGGFTRESLTAVETFMAQRLLERSGVTQGS